jgi:DNA-binding NtrC family response regulator
LKISKPALKVLLDYGWPGNVRQLRNTIERSVVLAEGEEITLDVLPQEIASKRLQEEAVVDVIKGINIPLSLNFKDAKREFERKYIERCLENSSGNITQAAAALGMHRQSLQHKIKELGLTKRFISTNDFGD